MNKSKNNQKEALSVETRHIQDIVELEKRNQTTKTSDKIAGTITDFSGSIIYVLIHVVWFIVWIALNVGLFPLKPFDPFPFSFLTMAVSLEAIFLSAFVLISQNRQALQADKRAKIDLEINMLSEHENTKMLELLTDIHKHIGIDKHEDAELKEMKKTTKITRMAKAVEKAENRKKK